MTTVRLDARACKRVAEGAPWLYREGLALDVPSDADVVQLSDGKRIVATAFFCPAGPIALRLLGPGALIFDRAFVAARLRAAATRRDRLPAFERGGAYRWVHGEADGLPGLFVDRYDDVAVIQTMTRAWESPAQTELLVAAVRDVMAPRLIVARNDGSARDFESLPRHKRVLFGDGPTRVSYRDAGSLVTVDVMEDGKTGGFLDQLENHAAARDYARPYAGGRGLDAFTYHGGFAMALASAGLGRVLALDESAAAVGRARDNAKVNQLDHLELRCANAFDELRRLESSGERFEVVVVDPPALAKRRSGDTAAERAYKELNLRAFRLVAPDGILISCSCSGRLHPERFGAILADAARDAGRAAQLLERRGAGRDHPPLLGVPETEYLKCWIMRIA